MVSKNKKWVDNNVLPASELNDNVLQPLSALDSTDAADVSVSTGSYVTKKTLAIDAGAVQHFVIIKFGIVVNATAGTGGVDVTGYAQITVDSSQKYERTIVSDGSEAYAHTECRRVSFKYEPTTDEKTNGFTIDVDGKYTGGATGTGLAIKISDFEVWGC